MAAAEPDSRARRTGLEGGGRRQLTASVPLLPRHLSLSRGLSCARQHRQEKGKGKRTPGVARRRVSPARRSEKASWSLKDSAWAWEDGQGSSAPGRKKSS